MRIPFLSYLSSDRWSLLEYDQGVPVHLQDVKIRLLSLARESDRLKPDYCFLKDYDDEMQEASCADSKTLASFLVNAISYLSKRYFELHKGILYVRKEMLDEWMMTVKLFPPLLLEAAFFLDDVERGEKDLFNHLLVPNFRHSTIRRPYHLGLEKFVTSEGGLADLHIHLNGSSETDFIWWSQVGNVEEWIESFKVAWRNQSVKRQKEQLSDALLSDFINHIRSSKRLFLEMVFRMDQVENSNILFSRYYDYLHPRNKECTPILALGAYFYLKVLRMMREGTLGEPMVRKFHHFLLVMGEIHRMLVQQSNQKGFSQFQMVTENGYRWRHENKNYEERLCQLSLDNLGCFTSYIEGRFSPKMSLEDNQALILGIRDGYEQLRCKYSLQNLDLQLIAHFIKVPDGAPHSQFVRHRKLRAQNKIKARCLLKLDEYLKYKYGKSFLVGIDAAANEMDAGPEVFAPTFGWLRKKWQDRNEELRITYHAGEDFQHLLSGLRQMIEALTFLHLEQGDRIGHGTAAGIAPELWIDRMDDSVKLSQGEWLDDLVMTYWLITTNAPMVYPELNSLLPRLHNDIMDLHKEIYGHDNSMKEIIEAWLLREQDPKPILERAIDGKYEVQGHSACAVKILAEYHGNKRVKEKYFRSKVVPIRDSYISAEVLRCLQNLVLHRIAKQGVALEVLFTSNIAISFYRESHEHHLGRWVEKTSEGNLLIPPVVVGTDDPGIFMTNIYTEYARIASYFENRGYVFSERLDMLKRFIYAGKYYRFKC